MSGSYREEVSSAGRKIVVREARDMDVYQWYTVRADARFPIYRRRHRRATSVGRWFAPAGAPNVWLCSLALCHETRDPAIRVNMNRFMHLLVVNLLPSSPPWETLPIRLGWERAREESWAGRTPHSDTGDGRKRWKIGPRRGVMEKPCRAHVTRSEARKARRFKDAVINEGSYAPIRDSVFFFCFL